MMQQLQNLSWSVHFYIHVHPHSLSEQGIVYYATSMAQVENTL